VFRKRLTSSDIPAARPQTPTPPPVTELEPAGPGGGRP
jgi:hypothetical protein